MPHAGHSFKFVLTCWGCRCVHSPKATCTHLSWRRQLSKKRSRPTSPPLHQCPKIDSSKWPWGIRRGRVQRRAWLVDRTFCVPLQFWNSCASARRRRDRPICPDHHFWWPGKSASKASKSPYSISFSSSRQSAASHCHHCHQWSQTHCRTCLIQETNLSAAHSRILRALYSEWTQPHLDQVLFLLKYQTSTFDWNRQRMNWTTLWTFR